MGNLCIIPARGGSKRIPKKNIKEFLGKPIIAYSIQIAQQSGLFDEIIVSTDDMEIAAVAKRYGAQVPFIRSKENSDDFAVLADVVDEVLRYYIDRNVKFTCACCILPTAPLIQMRDFTNAYNTLLCNKFERVHPIVKFSYPIQRAIKYSEDFNISFFYPEFLYSRSQDLEPSYHDAGQFYWFKSVGSMKSLNRGGIVISEKHVQDIDTVEDWELAEVKFKLINT